MKVSLLVWEFMSSDDVKGDWSICKLGHTLCTTGQGRGRSSWARHGEAAYSISADVSTGMKIILRTIENLPVEMVLH